MTTNGWFKRFQGSRQCHPNVNYTIYQRFIFYYSRILSLLILLCHPVYVFKLSERFHRDTTKEIRRSSWTLIVTKRASPIPLPSLISSRAKTAGRQRPKGLAEKTLQPSDSRDNEDSGKQRHAWEMPTSAGKPNVFPENLFG